MNPHCCGANKLFDTKEAEKSSKKYLQKGVKGATKQLIKMMAPQVKSGESLLDIGGGIGAVGLELWKDGINFYTSVDASTGYQHEAKKLFDLQGIVRTKFVTGDLVEEAPHIEPHQHVALDKVICCYPDMQSLLKAATERCTKQIGLVYPIGGIFSKFFSGMANIYLRLTGNAFRSYIHSPSDVATFMETSGFERASLKVNIPWRIEVWTVLPPKKAEQN